MNTFIVTLISPSQSEYQKHFARKVYKMDVTLQMILYNTCYPKRFLTSILFKNVICSYDLLNVCLINCWLFTFCHSDDKDIISSLIFGITFYSSKVCGRKYSITTTNWESRCIRSWVQLKGRKYKQQPVRNRIVFHLRLGKKMNNNNHQLGIMLYQIMGEENIQ